ncbi:MAG: L,D-transpeptidase family protein [Bacteroidales bacterium]|nr:L,D-transpeptidase family protein [Bacteroidales bacterium]MBN2761638.1 L,D-transpeptidase family protein [Bacteroidales bacterium]
MEPTTKATSHPTCSCKPLMKNRIINPTRKTVHFTVRLIALAALFVLSTSYQSHRKEMLLLEHDLFLPALKESMSDYFRQIPDAAGYHNIASGLVTIPLLKDFYTKQNYKPVWTRNLEISEQAVILLELLERSEMYGLEKDLFRIQDIRRALAFMQNRDKHMNHIVSRTNLEFLLTDACLKFMIYLKSGYQAFDSTLFTQTAVSSLPAYLEHIMKTGDFEKKILAVQPDFIEYRRLQQALEYFLTRTERNDDEIILPDPSKDSVSFRHAARKILISLGYLQPEATDESYSAALKKFQYYHGLEPDGRPGRNTCKALAQSTGSKFRQIALNLDRLRKENLSADQFIYVNIPAYQMRIYKQNKVIGHSKVIVGAVRTPTPLISSRIETVVTNPEWRVPRSITLNEMLPRLKSDSSYLDRNRMRLVDENSNHVDYGQVDWSTVSAETFNFRISQESGRNNSLGRVKFVFPSPYPIYLHDTPGKKAFSKDIRALSHGCVRVQHPEMLANYLVREFAEDNNDLDVLGMINKGISRHIALNEPVDLYIHYITCEADEDLNIFFYNDIYGKDRKELKSLESLM